MTLLASAGDAGSIASAVVVAFAGIVWSLQKLGLLKFGKSASDQLAELDLSERRADRLQQDNERLLSENKRLEAERSLVPIIDALERVTAAQDAVLEKLATFNGSLDAVRSGLHDATEGLRLVTGLIIEALDLPVHTPEPPRPAVGSTED